MYDEVMKVIKPTVSKRIFDGTFGRGGHTKLFLQQGAYVAACDRDVDAYMHGKQLSSNIDRLTMYRGCFSKVACAMMHENEKFDAVLLDLGMCSTQIQNDARGFSFHRDGPLDMRMGDNQISAFYVVNYFSYDKLCYILYEYGEERLYKKIAKRIVERRSKKMFYTTHDLSSEIAKCVPYKHKHPATRTFQAIRIYVNSELNEIVNFLSIVKQILKSGGIMVTLAFHSLEDRIVKRFINKNKQKMFPSEQEKRCNIRSRSAILRYMICK